MNPIRETPYALTPCALALALGAALLVASGCGDGDTAAPPPPPPPENRAPRPAGSIGELVLAVGGTVATGVSQYFSDPDGDALSYGATASNAAVASVAVQGDEVEVTGVAAGGATVTITARDPGGLSATQTMAVVVTAANRAPMAVGEVEDRSVGVGDTVALDAAGLFEDPDGDTLAYGATSGDSAVATATVAGSTVTVVAVGAGTATVTVVATDPGGESAELAFDVTVAAAANRAPMAVGEVEDRSVGVGDTVALDAAGLFEDPDGDTLAYGATSGDSAVATATVAGSTVTVVAVGAGTATVTVVATDPGGESAELAFDVTVAAAANRAPMAVGEVEDRSVGVGDTVALDAAGLFEDPDGDTLAYGATSGDSAVATATVAGSTVTVVAVGAGTATVTVVATDPGGESAELAFDVTVAAAANRAPMAVGEVEDRSVGVGDTVALDAAGLFEDPDGDTLAYGATSGDSAVATATVAGSTVTVVAVGAGTATVTVVATDPGGESAELAFDVTVAAAANRAPMAVGEVEDRSVGVGDTVALDAAGLFEDPDGDTLAYGATSGDSAVATATVAGSTVTVVAVGAGTATVTVVATDPGGESAELAFDVTVAAAANRAPMAVGEVEDRRVREANSVT